jgi:hypothetical protein
MIFMRHSVKLTSQLTSLEVKENRCSSENGAEVESTSLGGQVSYRRSSRIDAMKGGKDETREESD